MLQFLQEFYHRPDFWALLAIPLVAAFVGWVTNWIAIRMAFQPLGFVGFRGKVLQLGWQGTVPAQAERMAAIIADTTLGRMTNLTELFQEMEPERITRHIVRAMDDRLEEYVDEIMGERNSVLWENLPRMVRRRVYARARRQLPEIMDNIVEDIAQNIEELADLRQMVIRRLVEDKALMVRVFEECGEAELRFAVNSGLVFGLLLGLLQMGFYYFFPQNWVLPAFGFLVGLATNWLALGLIVHPVEPRRFGPFILQGLLLRRKDEVSEKFAEISAQEIINLRNLMLEVLAGPRSERTKAIVKRHLRPLLESSVVRTAVQLALGAEGYASLKHFVAERAVAMSLEPLADVKLSQERGGKVRAIFSERMKAMSNHDFQALVGPVFHEHGRALVMLGAIVGAVAGWLQLVVIFGG